MIIYTTLTLSNGHTAIVHELDGYMCFKAGLKAGNNASVTPYYLILECVSFDGKMIDEPQELSKYSGSDILGLLDHINCQLTKIT